MLRCSHLLQKLKESSQIRFFCFLASFLPSAEVLVCETRLVIQYVYMCREVCYDHSLVRPFSQTQTGTFPFNRDSKYRGSQETLHKNPTVTRMYVLYSTGKMGFNNRQNFDKHVYHWKIYEKKSSWDNELKLRSQAFRMLWPFLKTQAISYLIRTISNIRIKTYQKSLFIALCAVKICLRSIKAILKSLNVQKNRKVGCCIYRVQDMT